LTLFDLTFIRWLQHHKNHRSYY